MKKKFISTALILTLIISALAFAGCSSGEDDGKTEEAAGSLTGEVTIAAAASLENTMVNELIPLFKESNPDVTFTETYDSSGKLQEQIEGGLNAGIFMSAATTQMDALVDGGFIDRANVAGILQNEVVLIKASGSAIDVASFEDINKAGKIAIGDPASVPAGQYAEEILTNMNLWDGMESKLSLGTNVTEVLNWVAEGSADVGIVYKTDVLSIPDKVEIIESAPADSLKTPVIYPLGQLNKIDDSNKDATAAFFEFLQSEEALTIFEEAGFTIV